MDGSFRLEVPEGDYLVGAVKPGYLIPSAAAAMDFSLSEDKLTSLIASLPQVHVGAGQTASVNLIMHRGAVISGRMKYADGSPVIDAMFGCDSVDSVLRLERLQRPEDHAPRTIIQIKEEGAHDVPRFVEIEDDGTFQVNYLPPGSYILGISSTDDVSASADSASRLMEYKTVKLTAVVADRDVLLDDLLLVPLGPDEKNPEFSVF